MFQALTMGEEARRISLEDENQGPGAAFEMYEVMSNLVDKLKLLNYEGHFLQKYSIKPFSRHYFAIPTNPGEQFFLFTSLSSWLINVSGKSFEMPQEYDDPNATISNIMKVVRNFGIDSDFPPSKLKTGSGEFVCYILDKLATKALHTVQFAWAKPVYPQESNEEQELIQEEENEEMQISNMPNEEELDVSDSEDEKAGPLLDLAKPAGRHNMESKKHLEIMHSKTNADDWKLEVERVTPSLKVSIKGDNKEWRTHVEQMCQHKAGIETSFKIAKPQLTKLQEEIRRTLEKIGSREKYINSQLEQHVQEYRSAQDQLAQSREKYKQGSGGVTAHSRTLAELTEELEKVKADMEERGNSMTDGAPLVKIKQTLNRLKNECIQMDIRIGVIEHVVMQARLRDRTMMHKDMNKPAGEMLEAIDEDSTDMNYFANV